VSDADAATGAGDPTAVVQAFCAAWSAGDLDALMGFFADGAIYHNIPVDPLQGHEAIRSMIEMFTTGVDRIEFRIRNLAADGPVVLTERVDVFERPDVTIELPVMGAFEVHDGRITAWRDYFDLQQYMSQLPAS
jgi:limonene-1,2-epoxide hydrolase